MRAALIFGTRPEAIKMAPLVCELRATPNIDCQVWSTGQHREMLDSALQLFGVQVDHDLAIMQPDQTLNSLFARTLTGIDARLVETPPDIVVVHGDTSTAAAAATAAFHRGVPVAHIEAGLRSGRMDQPWPEEFNRRLVDMISAQLYAPTGSARANLIAEGVDPKRIHVTGNTVVDALLDVVARVRTPEVRARLDAAFNFLSPDRPIVLVTGHRRESFGAGFRDICKALRRLTEASPVQVVYPVHLNPSVRKPVFEILGDCEGVRLIEPVDYESFVYLMDRSAVILTDSGGVQEEAPSLGKMVLVMRDVTERPEAVAAGAAKLVGTNPDRIVAKVLETLSSDFRGDGTNPYGDGWAARRIVQGMLDASDRLR